MTTVELMKPKLKTCFRERETSFSHMNPPPQSQDFNPPTEDIWGAMEGGDLTLEWNSLIIDASSWKTVKAGWK